MKNAPLESVVRKRALVFAMRVIDGNAEVAVIESLGRTVRRSSIVHSSKSQVEFPGGKSAEDEKTLTATASREFREETCYELKAGDLSNDNSIHQSISNVSETRIYIVVKDDFGEKIKDCNPSCNDANVKGMKWVSLTALPGALCFDHLRFAYEFLSEARYQKLLVEEHGVSESSIKKFLTRTVAKIGT